jgi:ABC transport system ATP-binding/permease protein
MAQPIVIQLKDVALTRGATPVFAGADLALRRGERAALVGANGAGKSTLMAVLAGRLEFDRGERVLATGAHVALQDQEPDFAAALAGGWTLAQWAAQDLPATSDEATRLALAAAELHLFGLDPERSCEGLSGGEARRAALARVLAADPDLLLLDEPTNHLDIAAIEALEKRLKGFAGAILVISHDRAFLMAVSTACLWLRAGVVRRLDKGFAAFDGWAAAIEADERRTLEKMDQKLEEEARWLARGVTARRTRNEGRLARLFALRAERKDQAALVRKDRADLVAETGDASGKLVFEARSVGKAFDPDRPVVKGLDLRIRRGDRVGIVGPNGAGKSTLLKLLVGELEPDTGTIRRGTNLTPAYLDQSRASLDPAASLWDTFAPTGGDQIMVRGRPKHVAAYAKDFLFTPGHLRQPVGTFSGGERNRVMLALALARTSNLLVLDEPTNDLDMDTLDVLEEALAAYDGTVLLVSHDRAFLDGVVTSTLAPAGDGRWIETPGGWSELVSQGVAGGLLGGLVGGLAGSASAPGAARKSAPAPDATPRPKPAAKLSFKDEHRLKQLETDLPRLERAIAEREARLDDASLYTRDRPAFDRLMAELDRLRADLARAEEDWLAIETRREALQAD